MCLNPILRPNTNRHSKVLAAFGKDVDSQHVYVPCGHCPECIAARQNGLVQRVEAESRYNHMFFCTLTYDNDHLPVLSVEVPRYMVPEEDFSSQPTLFSLEDAEACLDAAGFGEPVELPRWNSETHSIDYPNLSGEYGFDDIDFEEVRLPFADIRHIQLLIKYLRNHDQEFERRCLRYIAVSELGKTHGRPHFHILFFLEKYDTDLDVKGNILPDVRYDLESRFWKAVFRGWSENVGTDKNPIYKPRFSYRKRFLGSRVYTNFDCHYVDPNSTTGGVSNVAYYVTKYMMKASEQEDRRYRFLKMNLSDAEFAAVWKVIKCRMLISKGLGLDARFYTQEVREVERVPLYVLAELQDDDLPPDFVPKVTIRKRRIMVPNFELVERLRSQLTRDAGQAPGPVYISNDGVHRPLAHYYQRFGFLYTLTDFLEIYMNFDDSAVLKSYEKGVEFVRRKYDDHARRLKIIENNADFDTSAALLWPTDFYDNNTIPVLS